MQKVTRIKSSFSKIVMKVYQNILRDINFIVLKNESESLLKIFKQKIAPKRCHF